MASSGGNVVSLGRGMRPPKLGSVWIARTAVAVGGVYQVAEDVTTPDDAAVTVPNSGAPDGALGNVVQISTAGGLVATAGGVLGMFVLAEELAASGSPFAGMLEGYYVDALVTTAAARAIRIALYPTAAELLNDTATGIGSPACGRLLEAVGGAITGQLRKVHFCGLPGGFGVGPGTT